MFAAGDCVTMESYVDIPYPTKAGVYAVKQGPTIAKNVIDFLEENFLTPYTPQPSFLALLMTGDGRSIGTKHGICFHGKWVWHLKDYIDGSFMNLFNAEYLFEDYRTEGTRAPLPTFPMFGDASADQLKFIQKCKDAVAIMDPETAARLLACSPEEDEYQERWQILERMHVDEAFREEVVSSYCRI